MNAMAARQASLGDGRQPTLHGRFIDCRPTGSLTLMAFSNAWAQHDLSHRGRERREDRDAERRHVPRARRAGAVL